MVELVLERSGLPTIKPPNYLTLQLVYGGIMGVYKWDNQEVEVDEDGFIQEPDRWSESLAQALAQSEEELDQLSPDHWKVINYLREYYKQFGIAPMIRKLCKDTGFELKYIYQLFPSGPAKGACKIAGLPKPTGCV